jgi:hypothetical protein
MRHYVMTASHRGPEYPLDASRRRIALCRGITARSLAAQPRGWTWLVYVHPDDPLREERLDTFREAGAPVIPVQGNAEAEAAIDWSGDILTTRIDDDDAFAGDAFARLYGVLRGLRGTTALMFPVGYRVHDGLVSREVHGRNAWVSIFARAGERVHVRQVQHQRIPRHFPVRYIDREPGWLRVRHADNDQHNERRAEASPTPEVRSLYPVDWSLLEQRVAA